MVTRALHEQIGAIPWPMCPGCPWRLGLTMSGLVITLEEALEEEATWMSA